MAGNVDFADVVGAAVDALLGPAVVELPPTAADGPDGSELPVASDGSELAVTDVESDVRA